MHKNKNTVILQNKVFLVQNKWNVLVAATGDSKLMATPASVVKSNGVTQALNQSQRSLVRSS